MNAGRARSALVAAVFAGGMEGVEAEFSLFQRFHPNASWATALGNARGGPQVQRIATSKIEWTVEGDLPDESPTDSKNSSTVEPLLRTT